jgi:hypothetical protein
VFSFLDNSNDNSMGGVLMSAEQTTDRWKVTYSLKGTFYSEHLDIGCDLSYLVAAMVAMDKVKEANPTAEDMTAQQV